MAQRHIGAGAGAALRGGGAGGVAARGAGRGGGARAQLRRRAAVGERARPPLGPRAAALLAALQQALPGAVSASLYNLLLLYAYRIIEYESILNYQI